MNEAALRWGGPLPNKALQLTSRGFRTAFRTGRPPAGQRLTRLGRPGDTQTFHGWAAAERLLR